MNKKIVSLATTALMIVATAVPVFAASPSTSTVMATPVTVASKVAAAKGYALTPAEEAIVATTPEEAVALSQGLVVETADVMAVAVQPAEIALAKSDILKNATVQSALAKNGVSGVIVNSGMFAKADGTSGKKRVTLSSAGLVAGQKVSILYYIPGDPTPHVVKAAWKNGKLVVTLPLPCIYNIVK